MTAQTILQSDNKHNTEKLGCNKIADKDQARGDTNLR